MAKNLLNEHQLRNLANVIVEVERSTSGELRLMLVKQSARTEHVFPLLGFMFATAGLLGLWYFRFHFVFEFEAWRSIAIVLASSLALAFLLSRLLFVRRLFTPGLHEQVLARAEVEFHREGLGNTAGRTGILIFLSLMEHQAVVLADRTISAKLPAATWTEVIAKVLDRAKRWEVRIEEAIRMCGGLLALHFPRGADDRDELPNHVIVKD
ncbi:MAG TPA: hypothetical protein PKC28_11665 [Bdellovibrionales bacterium]|nr:hypothetical protein [Bdellovibrionales bacterium]